MRKIIYIFAVVAFIGCQQKQTKTERTEEKKYPEDIAKIFEAHGGVKKWNASRTLTFEKGNDTHKIDLWSRKTVVKSPNYSMGYDGENVWVSDTTKFKGDPKFYYNLYFYFYAMPFVFADDGITYEKTADLTFEGESYPGYKISFANDKGSSPDDNYFLYFNKATHQMEWLGYTVTYFSKKPTTKANLIRYENWEVVNELLLPKSISWFKKDSLGAPLEPARPPVEFKNAIISKEVMEDTEFVKPE